MGMQSWVGVNFGISHSNRYSNNGAPIAMILCATVIKQCVFDCFLFTETARLARPELLSFYRDRAGGS